MKKKLTILQGFVMGFVMLVITTTMNWSTNKGCCDQIDSSGHGFPLMFWGTYSGGFAGKIDHGWFWLPFFIDLFVWIILGQLIVFLNNRFAKKK
jgi:hypothetical protein